MSKSPSCPRPRGGKIRPNGARGQDRNLRTPSQTSSLRTGKGASSSTSSCFLTDPHSPSYLEPSAHRLLVSQAAMKASLTGGIFVDTKFYAFSRKSRSGIVDRPKAVYANSAVLRHASKYFDGLLAGGYREDAIVPLDDPFPKNRADRTEDYEYFSDSDLDEEEEDVEFDDARSIWDFNASEADQVMSPEVANQCANSTLEDAASSATATTSNSVAPLEKLRINVENRNAGQLVRGRGRVIVLPDISFNTLQSLVYYLYTGEVSFANLKSQSQSSLFYHCIVPPPGSEPFAYRAPLCSPKSMYRVADKYGLDELKQKAADDIKTKLCAENIFQELFSTVTSTHDEIRSWQVAFACDKNIYETMAMNISPWISRVATGELAHCEPVVSDLIKQMAQNMKSASTPSPSEGKPKGKPRSGKQQDGPIGPWEHPELA